MRERKFVDVAKMMCVMTSLPEKKSLVYVLLLFCLTGFCSGFFVHCAYNALYLYLPDVPVPLQRRVAAKRRGYFTSGRELKAVLTFSFTETNNRT